MAHLRKNHLQCGIPGFDPWIGKIPWRKERLPTPVFWPREFHGLYRPWGHKESDMTEWLSLSLFWGQCMILSSFSQIPLRFILISSYSKKANVRLFLKFNWQHKIYQNIYNSQVLEGVGTKERKKKTILENRQIAEAENKRRGNKFCSITMC